MRTVRAASTKDDLSQLWESVGGTHEVHEVEALQAERIRSVYRLRFRNGHPPAIAKFCPTEDAELEHRVYREILPAFGIGCPAAYGVVPTSDPRRSWLFMGDVGGRPYDPARDDDRDLASEWLATLHIRADQHGAPPCLKDRSFDYYRPYLDKSTELLSLHADNPVLSDDEQMRLRRLLEFTMALQCHWQDIAAFCRSMPQTLIHGDFKEDNMRVVDTPAGAAIIAFDWANVGWGAPCLDLAKFTGYSVAPALPAYLQRCQRHWPDFDKADVIRLAYIGEIFRWIETVRWHVAEIEYGRHAAVMFSMAVYETWMDEIRRMEPWKESDLVSSGRWQITWKDWH